MIGHRPNSYTRLKPGSSSTGTFESPDGVTSTAQLNLKGHDGMSGQSLVVLSTQDWGCLWTRKQRFALQFARQGNRVLYVETQFHWLSYFKNFRNQWRRIYMFLKGPRRIEQNLYVYTPPLLLPAFQVFPALASINNFILGLLLKKSLRSLSMRQPVLWTYTHYNKPLIKRLGAKKALYECVDDYAGARGLARPEVVQKQEEATLRSVNAAIVTAESLKPRRARYNANLHVVSNAADVSHFNRAAMETLPEPADIEKISRPRLVFLGAIAYWIDLNLLAYLAAAHPDWQVVLIGPVLVDVSRFDTYGNVIFFGRKPHQDLPAYLAHCDVALNPYKVDAVSEGCSPLKLYEYLAAGLPVVSTEMPEARRFGGLVRVADGFETFEDYIRAILTWSRPQRNQFRKQALSESQKHSWESRFLHVERIVKEVLK